MNFSGCPSPISCRTCVQSTWAVHSGLAAVRPGAARSPSRKLRVWKRSGYRIETAGRQLGGVRQFRRQSSTLGEKSMKTKTRTKMSRSKSFAAGVGRALRRAAKDARKTARMYETPLYVWEDGKVVAKEP